MTVGSERKAFIKDIAYYLPERVLTNEQIAELFPEWPAEKIGKKTGITERHIAGKDETAVDMACLAAEALFANNPDVRSSVDFVIFCSQSPDYKLPPSACLIQHRLHLSTACGAFDMGLGCSGYEYGLAVAKGLILTGVAQNVLLITAEAYTKYLHPSDKGNRSIFGDAAAATVVSTEGYAEICNFVLGTDGSGAESLIVETGGARQPHTTRDEHEIGNAVRRDDFLFMDGGAIFNFSANTVPEMVNNLLAKERLTKEQVALWIFHQANKYMINHLRKIMDIDRDRFFVFMENIGNTVSSTIPIAIAEARQQDRLHGNVVLAGFGVGLSWGATLLKCE